MDYNKTIKHTQKSKILVVLAWMSLVMSIFVLVFTAYGFIKISSRNANYNREYIHSEYNRLYYLNNGNNVYVNRVINEENKIINPTIPNGKIAIMYCNKNNSSECMYYENEAFEKPWVGVLTFFVLLAFSSFILINRKKNLTNNDSKISANNVFVFAIVICGLGFWGLGLQIKNVIFYYKLKGDNIVYATIDSEIYNKTNKSKKEMYKPVSHYYVDGKKYIYVNDTYEYGTLNDNYGKKIELYYDDNNPSIAIKKNNPINIPILIMSIFLLIFTFPIVFFKRKVEERYYDRGIYGFIFHKKNKKIDENN